MRSALSGLARDAGCALRRKNGAWPGGSVVRDATSAGDGEWWPAVNRTNGMVVLPEGWSERPIGNFGTQVQSNSGQCRICVY